MFFQRQSIIEQIAIISRKRQITNQSYIQKKTNGKINHWENNKKFKYFGLTMCSILRRKQVKIKINRNYHITETSSCQIKLGANSCQEC